MISRLRWSGVLALMVSAGLLLGACGSSNSPSAKESPSPSPTPSKAATIASVDACSLVTADEASALMKTTVTSLSGATGSGVCIYGSTTGGTASATMLIFTQAYPDATAANAVSPEQIAAQLNGAYAIANAKPLSGVGDKAVEYNLSGAQGNGIVIFGFKANVVFMIVVVPPPDSTAFEKVAATAAGRIH